MTQKRTDTPRSAGVGEAPSGFGRSYPSAAPRRRARRPFWTALLAFVGIYVGRR